MSGKLRDRNAVGSEAGGGDQYPSPASIEPVAPAFGDSNVRRPGALRLPNRSAPGKRSSSESAVPRMRASVPPWRRSGRTGAFIAFIGSELHILDVNSAKSPSERVDPVDWGGRECGIVPPQSRIRRAPDKARATRPDRGEIPSVSAASSERTLVARARGGT